MSNFPFEHKPTLFSARRSGGRLSSALVVSVAAHAVAGSALISGFHREQLTLPRPLAVTLSPAPAIKMETAPAAKPELPRHRSAPKRSVPVIATHSIAPQPATPLVAERAVTTPAPVVVEPSPPPVVATAPSTANPPRRADSVELPHFDAAYLRNPRPAYPPMARRLGLEGVVVLRVQVAASGVPEQVTVAKTSGARVLDDAAVRAVQGWTFVPARRGDTPVAHPVDVPIRFHLEN